MNERMMQRHIAASGAKAGQWVACGAMGRCRNGGMHVTGRDLKLVQAWKNNSSSEEVPLKDLSLQDVKDFKTLPYDIREIYAAELDTKNTKAVRTPVRNAQYQENLKINYEQRNIRGLTDFDKKDLENVDEFFNQDSPQIQTLKKLTKNPPEHKIILYYRADSTAYANGIFKAEVLDYGQDKEILHKFFKNAEMHAISRIDNGATLHKILEENKEVIHKYVSEEEINSFLNKTKKTSKTLIDYKHYWRKNARDVSEDIAINLTNVLERTRNPSVSNKSRVKKLFSDITHKKKSTGKVSSTEHKNQAKHLSQKINSLFKHK